MLTSADAAAVRAARHLLPVGWVDPVEISNAATQLVVDAGLTEKV
jgi:hypothetical protein